jgi:hypothetical protein
MSPSLSFAYRRAATALMALTELMALNEWMAPTELMAPSAAHWIDGAHGRHSVHVVSPCRRAASVIYSVSAIRVTQSVSTRRERRRGAVSAISERHLFSERHP